MLSWDQAAGGTAFCSALDTAPPMRADCGTYHVVTTVTHFDAVTSYYYDIATGMLVAIVGVYAPAASDHLHRGADRAGSRCRPARGLASEPLSQCLDGGTDATHTPPQASLRRLFFQEPTPRSARERLTIRRGRRRRRRRRGAGAVAAGAAVARRAAVPGS